MKKSQPAPMKYLTTLILGVAVIILGYMSFNSGKYRGKLDYSSSLDEVAVEVDGQHLSLRDIAFYVAYEEDLVEKQAQAYDPTNTAKYWNLHIDGEFVRVAAKSAAMEMAIHDEIFYRMAMEEGVGIKEEAKAAVENNKLDFWNDLIDHEGDLLMGVSQEDIYSAMDKAAIAENYQEVYARLNGKEPADYDFNGSEYKELLKEIKYEVKEKVWDRVDFGNVSYSH